MSLSEKNCLFASNSRQKGVPEEPEKLETLYKGWITKWYPKRQHVGSLIFGLEKGKKTETDNIQNDFEMELGTASRERHPLTQKRAPASFSTLALSSSRGQSSR